MLEPRTAICFDDDGNTVYVKNTHPIIDGHDLLYLRSINRNLRVIAWLSKEDEKALKEYFNGNAKELS